MKKEPSQASLSEWSWGVWEVCLYLYVDQTFLSVPSLLHPEPFLGVVVPLALLSWNVLHSATSFPASLPFFVPRECVGFSMDHIGCQDGIRYASLVLGEGL